MTRRSTTSRWSSTSPRTPGPRRIEALLALEWADHVWLQGKRFGTVGGQAPAGVPCEVTTYRAEVYRPDSRKPEVEYGDKRSRPTSSRRDFTVNAMALRLPEPRSSTVRRRRRPRGAPAADALVALVSFADDPLRMLRVARFVARFGFAPTRELVADRTEHSAIGSRS